MTRGNVEEGLSTLEEVLIKSPRDPLLYLLQFFNKSIIYPPKISNKLPRAKFEQLGRFGTQYVQKNCHRKIGFIE